jgi:hypothetical protein
MAASFTDVEVAAGSSTTTKITLPAAILQALQARGIHTVQATLTLHNGTSTTTQSITIRVPNGLDVCPAVGGSITGTTLGLVHLGESIASIDDRYLDHNGQSFGFERFCLSTRGAIRVETPARKLLRVVNDSSVHGKVVLALTANRHYTLDGIHAGETLTRAEKTHKLAAGIVSGLNTWYLLRGAASNGVLKVQDGKIAEIGIASRRLTSTPADQVALFRQATLGNR